MHGIVFLLHIYWSRMVFCGELMTTPSIFGANHGCQHQQAHISLHLPRSAFRILKSVHSSTTNNNVGIKMWYNKFPMTMTKEMLLPSPCWTVKSMIKSYGILKWQKSIKGIHYRILKWQKAQSISSPMASNYKLSKIGLDLFKNPTSYRSIVDTF